MRNAGTGSSSTRASESSAAKTACRRTFKETSHHGAREEPCLIRPYTQPQSTRAPRRRYVWDHTSANHRESRETEDCVRCFNSRCVRMLRLRCTAIVAATMLTARSAASTRTARPAYLSKLATSRRRQSLFPRDSGREHRGRSRRDRLRDDVYEVAVAPVRPLRHHDDTKASFCTRATSWFQPRLLRLVRETSASIRCTWVAGYVAERRPAGRPVGHRAVQIGPGQWQTVFPLPRGPSRPKAVRYARCKPPGQKRRQQSRS